MTIKPNGGIEYRYVERSGAPKLENGRLSGRAAPFNNVTMIGKKPWGFREQIAKGAFAKSIKDGDVVLLDNHDTAKPIARQSAGTLKMAETSGGLDWDAEPANTTYANDAIENARAGNYGGCSFGFEVVRDSWHYNKDDDVDERTLHEVKVHEISVCTFPAYADGTSVSARDQVDAALEARDAYYEEEYANIVDGLPEHRGGNAPGNGKKPYGKVTYADPKNGKYPVDTKAHAKAAWSYINKPKNAAVYPLNGVTLGSVKAKIKAACKNFGITLSDGSGSGSPKSSKAPKSGKNAANMKTTKRSKLLAQIREIAFNEDRGDEADKQVGDIRQLLLADLVQRAEASIAPGSASGGGKAKAGKGAVSDGQPSSGSPDTNTDGTPLGDGDGDGDDFSVGNDSDPATKGKKGDSGGKKGKKKNSSAGLGLEPGANSKGTPSNNGTATTGSDSPAIGSGGPQAGKGSKNLSQNSEDTSDLEGRDGQPDTSTDPEGDEDAARRMRAIARLRREQVGAEATEE